MRPRPKGWDDPAIVQDEYFQTIFMCLDLTDSSRAKFRAQLNQSAMELSSHTGAIERGHVQAWLDCAFPKKSQVPTLENTKLFLHVHWALRKDRRQAEMLMDQKLKSVGSPLLAEVKRDSSEPASGSSSKRAREGEGLPVVSVKAVKKRRVEGSPSTGSSVGPSTSASATRSPRKGSSQASASPVPSSERRPSATKEHPSSSVRSLPSSSKSSSAKRAAETGSASTSTSIPTSQSTYIYKPMKRRPANKVKVSTVGPMEVIDLTGSPPLTPTLPSPPSDRSSSLTRRAPRPRNPKTSDKKNSVAESSASATTIDLSGPSPKRRKKELASTAPPLDPKQPILVHSPRPQPQTRSSDPFGSPLTLSPPTPPTVNLPIEVAEDTVPPLPTPPDTRAATELSGDEKSLASPIGGTSPAASNSLGLVVSGHLAESTLKLATSPVTSPSRREHLMSPRSNLSPKDTFDTPYTFTPPSWQTSVPRPSEETKGTHGVPPWNRPNTSRACNPSFSGFVRAAPRRATPDSDSDSEESRMQLRSAYFTPPRIYTLLPQVSEASTSSTLPASDFSVRGPIPSPTTSSRISINDLLSGPALPSSSTVITSTAPPRRISINDLLSSSRPDTPASKASTPGTSRHVPSKQQSGSQAKGKGKMKSERDDYMGDEEDFQLRLWDGRSGLGVTSTSTSTPQPPPVTSSPLYKQILQPPTKARLPKPPLRVTPPIWATNRQEVCESLSYFRSYQGGVYSSQDVTKGYLLSGFPACRDGFFHDGRMIISHGGGKADTLRTTRGKKSEVVVASDQTPNDKSVRALLSNFWNQTPLVLLMDDHYALFPYDLASKGVVYAVLGYYTIRYAWAEPQFSSTNPKGWVLRYKFLFEWCESQGDPWWLASSSGELTPPNLSKAPPLSPRKIKEEEDQPDFDLGNLSDLPDPDVDETPLGRTCWIKEEPSSEEHVAETSTRILSTSTSASPSRLADDLEAKPSITYPDSTVCPTCSQPSPQVYRLAWACLNSTCSAFWLPLHTLSPELLYNPAFLQLRTGQPVTRTLDILPPPLETTSSNSTSYSFTRGMHCRKCGRLTSRYKWEHWECANCKDVLTVSHIIRGQAWVLDLAKVVLPAKFTDNDYDIPSGSSFCFKRSYYKPGKDYGVALETFGLPGDNAFVHRIRAFGDNRPNDIFKEYQTQAADGKLAFRRWPLRAHKLRGSLLTNYFSQNCGVPYNYVGGTANTIPFDNNTPGAVTNARALIERRLVEALEIRYSFNEVLSAAYMEKQSMAFHSDSEEGLGDVVAGLSLGSKALMHFRRIPPKGEESRRKIELSLVLRHGDVLVMQGARIQTEYQHTVLPTNFRIAATARRIDTALNQNSGRAFPSPLNTG